MELTKRTGFDVGLMCNANCRFCYYSDLKAENPPSFKKLKSGLKLVRKLGIESVEFTGGEPTMRDDIFKLIYYAKQLGFKRMCMITNGILLKNKRFVEQLESSGLNEIKLSVHSSEPSIHDSITGVKQSFKYLMQGVKNIKKTNLKIKTNTVINRLNYRHLSKIAGFLIKIKSQKINLKFVTPIICAKNLGKDIIIEYSKAMPYLHEAINLLEAKGHKPTVRYIPFCFMKGYEKYVCNLCQVQYDPDEWDYVIKNRLEYGLIFSEFNKLFGYTNMFRRGYIPNKNFTHQAVIESKLLRFTTKEKICKKCKYDFICDGLWKGYKKLYGYSELKPVVGRKIKNPWVFMIK